MTGSPQRIGGLLGLLGAALLAAGLATLPDLPAPTAPGAEVFAFFLDRDDAVRAAVALITAALVLLAGLLAAMRSRLTEGETSSPAEAMFAAGLVAVGALAFSNGLLGSLAIGAEDADPPLSRSLLDLSEIGTAIGGIALAIALGSAAAAIRRAPGALPIRLAELSAVTALACALWAGRFFFETGPLAANGFLGSTLGWLLLLAWTAVSALLILGDPRRRPRAVSRS